MTNKAAKRERIEPILEDVATFALKQINSVTPMLFKDYLVRDNYTTASRRRACLCLKKLRGDYTELTDIVEIEMRMGDQIVDYYICASSELEGRVRLALENIGDKLKARLKRQGITLIVLPRDAYAEPLRR